MRYRYKWSKNAEETGYTVINERYQGYPVIHEYATDGKDFIEHFSKGYAPPTIDREPIADPTSIGLTRTNSDLSARQAQAEAFKECGYHGPVGGGEARALKNLFTEMGRPELVRRGYFNATRKVKRPPSRWRVRQALYNNQSPPGPTIVEVNVLQYCYVFKSPLTGVPFDKFVNLARLYKDDKKGMRKAVKEVLANPNAAKEVESLDAMDMLSGMAGM